MAEVINSLFGITPESLQAQRDQALQQEAMQYAKMDPFQRATAGVYTGASRLGGAIGGMLGAQDPEMMRLTQRQTLLKQAQPQDAAGWKALAQQLYNSGDTPGAQEALAKSQALQSAAIKQGLDTSTMASNLATAAGRQFDVSPEGRAQELAKSAKYTSESISDFIEGKGQLVALDKFAKPTPEFVAQAQALGFGDKPTYGGYTQEQAGKVNSALFAKELELKRAGADKGATFNMPPQEREEGKERGKFLVSSYADVSKQASVAARTLPSLESSLNIMDKGFDTGFGTEALATGAKVLAALGVEDAQSYATNAQSFLGAASQAVLTRQLEQKGPQTESDASRITQTGAQLGNTKEANRFLVSVAKTQFKRDLKQREFYDKWWKTNKTYDGAEDAWFSGEGGKSLFDAPELRKYNAQPASMASQIPTSRATPAAQAPVYAVNPTTKQRIMSTDGGTTWTQAR